MKEKAGTPVIAVVAVLAVALLAFMGWKFLGPKPAGTSTSSDADYQAKMKQMTEQMSQQGRSAPGQFRAGGTGAYPGMPGGARLVRVVLQGPADGKRVR